MARNKKGQFVSEHIISIKLTKALQEAADKAAIRVKPLIRDELEQTLRSEIYDSYTPATKSGIETQEYNKTHKHQKARPYHHTGLLASRIYAPIEGDIVKANVRDTQYNDGASTTEVYNYLKFGTKDNSLDDKVYSYDNGNKFSIYISQEPHNFEARTKEHMNQFLNNLVDELQTERGKSKYISKYRNKRA